MITVYDKAKWHIDGGEDSNIVIARLSEVLTFLDSKGLLTDEGKETQNLGVDSSISIHERMLNSEGNRFMEKCYDNVIGYDPDIIGSELEKEYDKFIYEGKNNKVF